MITLESETETMTDNEIILIDDPDLETTCVICSAEFLDKSDLKIHISEMHSEEQIRVDISHKKCHFCDDFFPSSEDYVYHLRNVHLQDLSICEYCSRVFINNTSLKRHSIKHNNLTTKFKYSCSQCKSCFANIHELESHEMDHGDCDGGFYLNSYFPLLSSIINIKADRFIRSFNKGEEYYCSICKFSSTVVSEYIQHLRVSNCRSLVCDKCSNVYTNKAQLKKHLKYYDSTDNCIKKRCQQCGLGMYKTNIRDHKKTCAAIKCLTCNILFTTIDELTKHRSEKHPLAVSLLSCKFCRKEFIGTVALSRHMHKKHVGEEHLYKYICVYCRFVYKHPKALFIHFYTAHSDIQPYTCKICTIQYRTRKAFTLHIKMVHDSVGFVEFDRNYEVFFTDKKSDNPFTPQPIYEPILGDKVTKSNNKVEDRNETLDPDKESECMNVDYLDLMSATENEGNGVGNEKEKIESKATNTKYTEKDTETATDTEKQKVAKKRKRVTKKRKRETIDSDNSDDEPLLLVKKRMKTMKSAKLRHASWNKKKIDVPRPARKEFTCKYCKKYCYTYQNYNHHMTLHKKSSMKQCTKCEQVFQTSEELIKHTNDTHSSSLLTETLKTIKERKRLFKARQENVTSKFINTIKKCTQEMNNAKATITPVAKGMSVKKFIENFTPDGSGNQSRVVVNGSLSIKKVIGQTFTPKIRMEKYKESNTLDCRPKLKMPQKFLQENNSDEQTATISIAGYKVTNKMTFETNVKKDFCDDDDDGMDASIPDVAEEVLLQEEQDEDIKTTQNERNTQIIIPKVSAACKDIRIAHLSNEAPFYKIVKLEDLLKEQASQEKVEVAEKPNRDTLTMSNGIKLVNVNPLAHLIGDAVEKKPPKRYKPKPFDYKKALAEALTRLDSPNHPKLKRNKSKDSNTNQLSVK